MGMQVGDRKGGPMADINVTPLVDVVLVLLIIFMIVTPMLASPVEVNLPGAKKSEEAKDLGNRVVLFVGKNKDVYVGRAKTELPMLPMAVTQALEAKDKRELLIKADSSLTWRDVHDVMTTLHDNVANVSVFLATKKPDEETAP